MARKGKGLRHCVEYFTGPKGYRRCKRYAPGPG